MVRIGELFERTWIICHFNEPLPSQLISFLRVPITSFFLVWVIETVCMFVLIYTTFLVYLLTTFLDDIEVWCNWPVAFMGSCILKMPEIVIVGFFLVIIFVWMHPSSKFHIVALGTCLCNSFDILVLEESYETLLANFMTKTFSSALSNF